MLKTELVWVAQKTGTSISVLSMEIAEMPDYQVLCPLFGLAHSLLTLSQGLISWPSAELC